MVVANLGGVETLQEALQNSIDNGFGDRLRGLETDSAEMASDALHAIVQSGSRAGTEITPEHMEALELQLKLSGDKELADITRTQDFSDLKNDPSSLNADGHGINLSSTEDKLADLKDVIDILVLDMVAEKTEIKYGDGFDVRKHQEKAQQDHDYIRSELVEHFSPEHAKELEQIIDGEVSRAVNSRSDVDINSINNVIERSERQETSGRGI